MTKHLLLLFAAWVFCGDAAVGQELRRFEGPCQTGPAALRQTIVLLDDAFVGSEPIGHPAHLRWTRPILDAADLLNSGAGGRLLPRERFSVFLARRASGDVAPLLVSCSPNLDASELERLRTQQSSLSSFLFGSVERDVEALRKQFDAAVRDAIGQVPKGLSIDRDPRTATLVGLIPALRVLSQSIDLSRGVPRIVILSPFSLEATSFPDQKAAREAAFLAASDHGLDMRRSEIVAVGFAGNQSPYLQAYVESFFLRSKGALVGWRSDGLPQLPGPPVSIRVFGGSADYGDIAAPVQIRISSDAQGNLVNSWVEVTAGRSLASPISGKAICRSKDNCEVRSDGRLFGQAWNPDPKERPVFDERYAWAGMRYFELKFDGAAGQVRIFDPLVSGINLPAPNGGTRRIDAWSFEVRRTDDQQF